MNDFKDKFDDWMDDAWKVDTFIDEYNYEQEHKNPSRQKSDLPNSNDKKSVRAIVITLCILAVLVILCIRFPFLWIPFIFLICLL